MTAVLVGGVGWGGVGTLVVKKIIEKYDTSLQHITHRLPPFWRLKTSYQLLRSIILFKCVCVVCVFSSHSFWTSNSLDVPAGVTQEEGHTGFLIHFLYAVRALSLLARRIQPFLSLVDREVEFCVLTI